MLAFRRVEMTLELYHGASSVCSSKVRIALAEKGLDWVSCPVDLKAGEQFAPDYLNLNPNGVVPTLVHGELVVVESAVILEYVDALSSKAPLMPRAAANQARARMWLSRGIEIHAAINTMTFATAGRAAILRTKNPDQIEAMVRRMPNPANAAKRRALIDQGLAAPQVVAAFFTLRRLFDDMQSALGQGNWLLGDTYSLADTSVLSYVDRLDRLGFAGMWSDRTPAVARWLEASRKRASYAALAEFISAEADAKMRADGGACWPELAKRWKNWLDG